MKVYLAIPTAGAARLYPRNCHAICPSSTKVTAKKSKHWHCIQLRRDLFHVDLTWLTPETKHSTSSAFIVDLPGHLQCSDPNPSNTRPLQTIQTELAASNTRPLLGHTGSDHLSLLGQSQRESMSFLLRQSQPPNSLTQSQRGKQKQTNCNSAGKKL